MIWRWLSMKKVFTTDRQMGFTTNNECIVVPDAYMLAPMPGMRHAVVPQGVQDDNAVLRKPPHIIIGFE